MPEEYRDILVTHPNPATSAVRDADLVIVNHGDGTWSIPKDRWAAPISTPVPWDGLPSRVKRAARPCL